MKIALIRHGMTAGNKNRKYIGSTDDPLCEEGIALAESVRGDARPSPIFVTPLQRTQQTAEILFPGCRQIVVDGLREMNFGAFEGRSADDMVNDAAYRAWVDGGCTDVCPGGEGMEGFRDRVCRAFTEVVAEYTLQNTAYKVETFRWTNPAALPAGRPAAEAAQQPVTFVVHGGVIMAILSTFADEKKNYYDYFVHNCCGYLCNGEWVQNTDEQGHAGRLLLTALTPICGSHWSTNGCLQHPDRNFQAGESHERNA